MYILTACGFFFLSRGKVLNDWGRFGLNLYYFTTIIRTQNLGLLLA